MTYEEINELIVNIICYVCDVEEERVQIGWQSQKSLPNYGNKIFYVRCDNKAEADKIAKITNGHTKEQLDVNYYDGEVVIPLGNLFK